MRVALHLNKNLLLIAILISSLLIGTAMAFDNKGYDHKLQIINQNNNKVRANLNVKISDNTSSQTKGLMFVKDLPTNYGMLFDFKEENIINMWMKNTLISLDMIFIDKDDKIIKIVANTIPLSDKIISSNNKAVKVLEVNAGVTKSLAIDVGDKVVLEK